MEAAGTETGIGVSLRAMVTDIHVLAVQAEWHGEKLSKKEVI